MTKKQISILISSTLVLIAITISAVGIYQLSVSKNQLSHKTKKIEPIKEFSYKGKNGISALALLEQIATIKKSNTGESTFVTAINNMAVDSTKNEFWSFNVNNKPATVDAENYITKDSDDITWKIDSF